MYLVRALGDATAPKRFGEMPVPGNWKAHMIDAVDHRLIKYYKDHSDVFEIIMEDFAYDNWDSTYKTLTYHQSMDGIHRRTRFVLNDDDTYYAVANGVEYGAGYLYDFLPGPIQILGVYGELYQKTTSALTTLNSAASGRLSIGIAEASSTTLTGDAANIVASTTFAASTAQNVAGSVIKLVGASQVNLTEGEGTSMYLNFAYPTTAEVDADATQTFTGFIDMFWRALKPLKMTDNYDGDWMLGNV